MNIIKIDPKTTQLKLSAEKQQFCLNNKCYAYINPSQIGVTTCGTRIQGDNIFAQRDITQVSIIRKNDDVSVVNGYIDNQPITAITSTQKLEAQNLFEHCAVKPTWKDQLINMMSLSFDQKFSKCQHVKLIIPSESIFVATESSKNTA